MLAPMVLFGKSAFLVPDVTGEYFVPVLVFYNSMANTGRNLNCETWLFEYIRSIRENIWFAHLV